MMRKRNLHRIFFAPLLLSLLLAAGYARAAPPPAPRNPNSAKACAICHYRWIDTFFVQGRGSDLVPYQSEKVAATPDMCFSCHDGSVRDSRERMLRGSGHKVDVKPPAGMEIPGVFPLDENGRVQCATCHTAHGVESGPGVRETIFLRTSNIDSVMCGMCHPDKAGGTEAGNHSSAAGGKRIPKFLLTLGAHEGRRQKNRIICETCHTAHGAPREGYLVKGAGDCGLCLVCHTEMNMFDAAGRRNANHAVNVPPRIATVAETLKKEGARLGYGGVIACQTCHKIHNNPVAFPFLLLRDNHRSALCFACHPDKKRIEKTRHNLAVSAGTEKNLQGETATESGICSACHLPHKPARTPVQKNEDTDRTEGLCLSCHAKGMFAENKKLTGYAHPVDIGLPKGNHTDLPLYSLLGVKDEKGRVTCATCHDTHGGAVVQQPSVPGSGQERVRNTLLRRAPPEICRACHAEKFSIENTRHDLGGLFPQGHPIIRQNVPDPDLCRNCHLVHSSGPQGFIWNRQMVTRNGDRVYDHCGRCHEKTGLAPDRLVPEVSHAVHIPLPGNMGRVALPLFNAAGHATEGGLMTCETCHDPHRRSASRADNRQERGMDASGANSFLRVNVSPGSELCIRCHRDKKAVRRSDHNLMVTAPLSKNIAGKTAFESGVCGACHLTHQRKAGGSLWARELGGADQLMVRMCNSCHREDGSAHLKIPRIATHPKTLFIMRGRGGGAGVPLFPLFDRHTGAPVKVGDMSCPSCHEAHQWAPTGEAQGPEGINREGDALTSFLRANVPETGCKECHGREALYMFKYFHMPEIRKKKPVQRSVPLDQR
jgi:predicted CXXCH cytochrome family protein